MAYRSTMYGRRQRNGLRLVALGIIVLGVAVSLTLTWFFGDEFRSPQALYDESQSAKPARAEMLYHTLAEKLPAIEEYAQLWTAEATMPRLEAIRTLQTIIAFRPQSPAAYQAHIEIARHYASLESPEAEEAYRAALALNDTLALRLELARFLEERGDNEGAYTEYRHILDYRNVPGKSADAFAGMRRTGPDPVTVAEDLIAATYVTDALETLRDLENPETVPVRGRAFSALGRYDEAEQAYQSWLAENPTDTEVQLRLARVLLLLGRVEEGLKLYEEVDTPDSQLALAGLLEEEDPERALTLYLESPYPVAWWSATSLLESQGRLTETLPIYERLANSDTDLADDAAYRLFVVAQRVGDRQTRTRSRALLEEFGLNWLALRATKDTPQLDLAPPLEPAGDEILAKVEALEQVGRGDLAHLELTLAARFRQAAEIDLAMAAALSERGYIVEAQSIAENYIADHPRAPLAFWQLSYPRPYSTTVQSVATEFNIDPLLIWAVMREESRYDPDALSHAGARGLMQVIPATQVWIAGELGQEISPGEAYLPETSIRMGGWLLSFLSDYFEGDLELAIPAYNAGAGSVESWLADPLVANRDDLLRWISYDETRLYLERVSLSYQIYQELYPDE